VRPSISAKPSPIIAMPAKCLGISSNQLHRVLGITLKSAWFMSHRIREAMTDNGTVNFGAGSGTVEVEETFIGREPGKPVRRGVGHKMKMLTLVDRATGQAKSIVVDDLKIATLLPILKANIAAEATIHTDEAMQYDTLRNHFAGHETVNHGAEEYVRGGRDDEHRGRLLQQLQARHERCLLAWQQEASAPLCR
jgi:transposase-like protein